MEQTEVAKDSAFNEAALKMNRLNELQRTLNIVRSLIWNRITTEEGDKKYGCEIIATTLESLFMEVSGKLTQKEKEEGLALRKKLWWDYGSLTRFNPGTWPSRKAETYAVSNSFFNMELFLRRMLEVHNLSAPNKKNPGAAVLG